MDRNVRPSGLTAFAIINFIFGGLTGLGVMFSLGALTCTGAFNRSGQAASLLTPEATAVLIVVGVMNLALMVLLVLSGIGYLRVNPILGRLLGSLFAVGDILKTIWQLAMSPITHTQFTLLTMTDFIWPLLTLVFINIVFRDVWRARARLADLAGSASLPVTEGAGKNAPHLFLVMAQNIRQTLRGVQGVIFVLIALTVSLGSVQMITFLVQSAQKYTDSQPGIERSQSDNLIKEGVKQISYGFFVWLLDDQPPKPAADNPGHTIALTQPDRDAWADYLTAEKPALLSFVFAVLMTLFPMLGAFLVFNQISEDARRKGFRYLLLRTTRASIYFGKFLSAIAILVPIIVLSVAAIVAFIQFQLPFYSLDEVVTWSLWAIVMLVLGCVPAMAFCMLVSALINSGFGSLAAGALTLGLLPIIARGLKDAAGFLVFLQYLLPQKVAYFLMHPQWWAVLLAALGCCLYAAVYSVGGYLYFKRKSL